MHIVKFKAEQNADEQMHLKILRIINSDREIDVDASEKNEIVSSETEEKIIETRAEDKNPETVKDYAKHKSFVF